MLALARTFLVSMGIEILIMLVATNSDTETSEFELE